MHTIAAAAKDDVLLSHSMLCAHEGSRKSKCANTTAPNDGPMTHNMTYDTNGHNAQSGQKAPTGAMV